MPGCTRLLVVTALAVASSPAFAHDPPEVMRIAWPAPQSAVFQTQRGFIVGDTEARSYRWACVEGLEAALGEQPGFVVLPGGVWMVATEHGLLTSSDQGCHWNAVERFGGQVASAVTLAPDDSKHVLVALAGAADGGLFESRDAGASWQKRMHLAADDYVAQILIAPSEPARLYLSGLVIDEQADLFSFQITRSSDGGATWERAYVPLAPDEDQAVLAAVSPTDPTHLLVLARNHRWGERPDRVLFSQDAGASYRELTRAIKLTGAAFSADGDAIIVAGGDSLSRIELPNDAAVSSEPIGMSQMLSCAQAGPAGLYACGHVNIYDPLVYGASISTDDGKSFRSLMSFTEVKERIACTNEAFAKACSDQWLDWQLEILVGLGGASIDSVDGWMDFKGIPEVEHPAHAHTLSTARRSGATSAAEPAAADGGAAPSGEREAAAAGCQTSPTGTARGAVWTLLSLVVMAARSIRRARVTVTS
jgi:hypothetical protein